MTPVSRIRSGGDPHSIRGGSGAISDIGDFREPEETPIKFGSFSLGDVFERERYPSWDALRFGRGIRQEKQRRNSWRILSDFNETRTRG
jgi:hypothetical protein